jgi:hypothetical protein
MQCKYARTDGCDHLFKCMIDEAHCNEEMMNKCFFRKPEEKTNKNDEVRRER